MFAKRIGPDPHANRAKSAGCQCYPAIGKLDHDDFTIIGLNLASCAPKWTFLTTSFRRSKTQAWCVYPGRHKSFGGG